MPAPTVLTGARASWLRIRAVARRHAYVLVRSPHRLFDVTLWPLVDVLLFGSLAVFVGDGDRTVGQQASGYLLAGIVLWHVIYQSQIALSTGLLEETWTRNLLNLMITPIREWEYVAGVALFGMAKLFFGLVVMTVGALAFFSFDITELGLGVLPVAFALLVVGWMISFLVMGLVLRFGTGAEAMAWGVMFVVMPLSGVFYPVESLPGLLQPIAHALPTTHAFAALRALVDGDAVPWDELGYAYGSAAVLLVLAMLFLLRMLSLFRTRGYVTRYS
ncbi:MAG TPA: ABC transporter permease [Acidimicrobiia bacterium]|nr:ABC transporter permease [Acidimicrobiia bacterium]